MDDDLPSCDVCFRTDLKLLACGQCHVAKYCGVPHQKLVWYTHKHICDLMKVGEDALFYAPQCKFSDYELRLFGLAVDSGRSALIFPIPVGTSFDDERFEINKAETSAALKTYKSSIMQSRVIAHGRHNISISQPALFSLVQSKEKHLQPFYHITPLIISLQERKCQLPSKQMMLTVLMFHAVMSSSLTRAVTTYEENLIKSNNIVAICKQIVLKLNQIIVRCKKEGAQQSSLEMLGECKDHCDAYIEQWIDGIEDYKLRTTGRRN